eukprot:TRINITY_DN43474_c0_g1_i1.p1 TRINITY_DN43474_c0_g1~~TRINITY_DN43474_c0_g1_i1.p1  ORF type:complete len:140 (-),score=26.32 TRINITY_DN43474_c0_g1_i1:177-596(-)
MTATYAQQRKVFLTAQEEVAHNRLIQNKWYPGGQPAAVIENEEEVKFIGPDCYVPRLVAASVPIAKPAMQGTQQGGYSNELQAKRPVFLRGGATSGASDSSTGLPSGGGVLPKGRVPGQSQEQPKEPSFPFNLIGAPGL